MARLGSLLSSSDAVTPEAVIEYPGGAVVQGLTFNSAAAATANTAAINAAILATIRNGNGGSPGQGFGALVVLPAGDIHINDTILIQDAMGMTLAGDGHSTRLIWQGNDATKPMIRMSHTRQCKIRDIFFWANTACYTAIQCRRDNHIGAIHSPTLNSFSRLFLSGSNNALFGVVLGGTGSVDANNDFNSFYECEWTNYTKAGFMLDAASQSFGNLMINCRSVGQSGVGEYAVYTGPVGGHFHWIGGAVGQHRYADFCIGRSYQPYTIEAFNSESSAQLLELRSTAGHWHAALRDFRWSGAAVTADYGNFEIINATGVGLYQLEISNARMGDGGASTGAFVLRVPVANDSAWKLEHCDLFSSAADPFPGGNPTSGAGNVKITNEGAFTHEALTWA